MEQDREFFISEIEEKGMKLTLGNHRLVKKNYGNKREIKGILYLTIRSMAKGLG